MQYPPKGKREITNVIMLKKKQKQSWSIGTTMCYIYLSFFIHKFQLNLCDSLSSSTINCVINIIKHYSCHQNMVPFHLYAASTTTINQVYHETLLMSSIHLQKKVHAFYTFDHKALLCNQSMNKRKSLHSFVDRLLFYCPKYHGALFKSLWS